MGEAPDRVLVVGAGPVGLVAALRLAEFGIPVALIETAAGVSDDLRASTFHPTTLDMLAPYGLTAALDERGLRCPTWQIRMHETGERAVFDLSLIADETDHPYRLQCEQAHLAALDAERLARESSVEIHFGTELVGLTQDADGVTATVRRDGEDAPLSARWLIGADGGQSAVRRLAGISFAGDTYPETTVLATTPFPFHEVLDDLSVVNYCWSAEGNFALLQLPGLWRCSLYFDPTLGLEEAVEMERVQAQLRRIHPAEVPFEIHDKRPYRVHQRLAETWRRGRVPLAGDAAHLNSPSGGMGMNGGIHDAFNVTEKLKAVWEGAEPDLLDRYERQRRPVAAREILAQADRNRKRMLETDPGRRRVLLGDLQAITADPERARAYLRRSAMIEGLRQAEAAL